VVRALARPLQYDVGHHSDAVDTSIFEPFVFFSTTSHDRLGHQCTEHRLYSSILNEVSLHVLIQHNMSQADVARHLDARSLSS